MFKRADIDRAIVITLYDLDGFLHPLGFRQEKGSSNKSFQAIAPNFVGFAAGNWEQNPEKVDPFTASFDEYLEYCKQFAAACDVYQKELAQRIVKEIFKQHQENGQKLKRKKRIDKYHQEITKDTFSGKIMICLATAFELQNLIPAKVR